MRHESAHSELSSYCNHGHLADSCVICKAGKEEEWPCGPHDKQSRCIICGTRSWQRKPGDRCRIESCVGRVVLVTCLIMLLCIPAQANVIDFVAAGRGLDETRLNRITGRLAYNPNTTEITHISKISYQGLQEWEVGRLDLDAPYSGTYDGQMFALTAFGGLDRHDQDCGKIATATFLGDLEAGDVYFSVQYPSEVPAGCTLADHFAEGRTTGVTLIETVPEPSGWVLALMGGLGLWRWTSMTRWSSGMRNESEARQ